MADEALSIRNAHARRAAGAMSALAHSTSDGRSVSPPEATMLLSKVAETLLRMSDSLRGIGNGLRQSLQTHGVAGPDGEPADVALVRAQALLQNAADAAAMIVDDVWRARDGVAPFGVTRLPGRSDDAVSF
ncbi:hypothetical protein [Curtobacterium sp. 20TX0008]|uniref:hypothetical protein n=1 Tax=Curtobacterium sp. 20TX0008 TaxID=3022018 RepID=UPI00232E24B8|nr:hypothetical protein [Curtobacterium sp. 20TX0008]MDB6425855.1 hypothetical protein [Curtobacterium sp. 20TX0008]